MVEYINKSVLVAEIERRISQLENKYKELSNFEVWTTAKEIKCKINGLKEALSIINTLEVKEVDLEKLGEIARHLIVVKERIEDMRLDKEEWFMLEKIGYPEKFKGQKGEEV